MFDRWGQRQCHLRYGDTCESFGKRQLDISGSKQTVYGGVHSNDNADVGGQDNDFGSTNPGVDPFTYVSSITPMPLDPTNTFDAGYPTSTTPQAPPIVFSLADYQPGGSSAVAAGGNYHYVTGDIDGAYIESNGMACTTQPARSISTRPLISTSRSSRRTS